MSRTAQPVPDSVPTGLLDRIASIVMLDDATYEAVKRDPAATRQAAVIVVVVTLSGAIDRPDNSILWQVTSAILAVAGWPVGAWLAFKIGTRLLGARPPQADWSQMLRLNGFVMITSLGAAIDPVEIIGPVVSWSLFAWGTVLSVKAIKHVLLVGTGRAIAVFALSTLVVTTAFLGTYFSFEHWNLI